MKHMNMNTLLVFVFISGSEGKVNWVRGLDYN